MKKMGRPPKHSQIQKRNQHFESVIRTGGRVKKIKKVFDPSENNAPRKRTNRVQSASATTNPQQNDNSSQKSGGTASSKYQKQQQQQSYYMKRKKLMKMKARPDDDDFCSICMKMVSQRPTFKLINCKDCDVKAHRICMKTNFVDKKLLEAEWRCENCKTCVICYETVELGALYTCTMCIKSYHFNCHVPKIIPNTIYKSDWKCFKCSPNSSLSSSTSSSSSTTTTQQQKSSQQSSQPNKLYPSILKSRAALLQSSLSTVQPVDSSILKSNIETENNEKTSKLNEKPIVDDNEKKNSLNTAEKPNNIIDNNIKNIVDKRSNLSKISKALLNDDGEIPDVSNWSCAKLANYFEECFPNEAGVLREQEIDGASLLLMTRSDVISGLGLKLGPAIRLHNFIIRLQTKRCDPFSTWTY